VGISIAVPALDLSRVRLARYMIATKMPPGVEVIWKEYGHALAIDKARNNICQTFLTQKIKTDRLWMVDDDMVWHPDSVKRLYERDLDIVAGLSWTNAVPPVPTIWKDEREVDGTFFYTPAAFETLQWMIEHDHNFTSNDPVVLPMSETDLEDVPATGGCFLMIKRRVLEAIEPPWFEGDVNGFGEDFYFCRKARAAGFKVYVDRSVIVTHYPRFALGPLTYRAFMAITRMATKEEKEETMGSKEGEEETYEKRYKGGK